MGTALLQIKVMPKQSSDLESLKEDIKEKVESVGGTLNKTEEKEVAFGLKALIVTIALPEEKETFIVEKALSEIKEVSSIDIIDYRRAFG